MDLNNILKNDIDINKFNNVLIPYFIQEYGEEYRHIITNKYNTIKYINYSTVDDLEYEVNKKNQIEQIRLMLKYLKLNKKNIPYNIEIHALNNIDSNILKNQIINYNLLNLDFDNMNQLELDLLNSPNIATRVNFLNTLGVNVTPWNYNTFINTEAYHKIYEYINTNCFNRNIVYNEYNSHLKKIEKMSNLIEKYSGLKNNINNEFMFKYLDDISKYLSDFDKTLIEDFIIDDDSNINDLLMSLEAYQILIPTNIENESLVESFHTLKSSKYDNDDVASVIENQIKYFNCFGNNVSTQTYFNFINSDYGQSCFPNIDMVNDITNTRKKYANMAAKSYINQTSTYKSNLNEIKNLNLVNKSPDLIDIIRKESFVADFNYTTFNNQLVEQNVIYVSSTGKDYLYKDIKFINEINKVMQSSLMQNNNPNTKLLIELFSYKIAVNITEKMHNNNVMLFSKKAAIHGDNKLDKYLFLIEDIYNYFETIIKKSIIFNNFNIFISEIGEQNFIMLNNIINEFDKIPYELLMESLNNNINNNYTVFYKNILHNQKVLFYNIKNYVDVKTRVA